MNILISVNESYLDKAESMLLSVRKHTVEPLDIYLLNHSLTEQQTASLDKYLKRHNISLHIVDTKFTKLDRMTLGNSHFSIEMYYRIIAQFLLPSSLDRILWLDADIIVLKDLKEFYFQNFDDKAMVVCPDSKYNSGLVSKIKVKLGLPEEHIYFNSGVLLLNLPYLREKTELSHIVSVANELEDRLTYPDQDILNYLYQNEVKYAEWKKYNFQVIEMRRADKATLSEVVIVHYSGPYKPWDYSHINSLSKYYWRIAILRGGFFVCVISYTKNFVCRVVSRFKRCIKR